MRLRSTLRIVCSVSLRAMCLTFAAAGVGACRSSSNASAAAERGRRAIATLGCGACHLIDGVPGANGLVGPSLAGIASRAMIGGDLPNDSTNLLRWIVNPQAIRPGVAMPPLGNVSAQRARDVVAYLETLR
ncbi:MAG TPA: c-type cytochrome [Gemmatimonadaceae bacterium]|nr:c-type cytochrome [Gemmatimonadaceae bacterium]